MKFKLYHDQIGWQKPILSIDELDQLNKIYKNFINGFIDVCSLWEMNFIEL